MSKFCEACDNLLQAYYNNDRINFRCVKCHLIYESDDKDTLRYEKIKESNVMIYEKILNKAVDDPATIKAYMKCVNDKCSGKIVKQVRLGDDMRLYNICTTCRSQWLN